MTIYAVRVCDKFANKFGYEDEIVEFCATKEVAHKVLEEQKEEYAEFDNELYIEEIHVREE